MSRSVSIPATRPLFVSSEPMLAISVGNPSANSKVAADWQSLLQLQLYNRYL
jgi:hypothetical protein